MTITLEEDKRTSMEKKLDKLHGEVKRLNYLLENRSLENQVWHNLLSEASENIFILYRKLRNGEE